MTVSVTSIGTASATSGSTVSITVPVGGVPAGALIVLATETAPASSGNPGSGSDSAGNTYTLLTSSPNNGGGSGAGNIFYAYNVNALTSGQFITFTATSGVSRVAITAIYATGIQASSDPNDTGVKAVAVGSGTSPSVMSGAAAAAGELFVGVVTGQNNVPTITQSGSFTTPPNISSSGAVDWVGGGTRINAGTTAIVYSPTLSNSSAWSAFVYGFKAIITVPITGVAGTGSVGNVTPSVSTTATGVAATGQVGNLSLTISFFDGVSATGQVGSVGISASASPVVAGVSATGQVGTLTPSVSVTSVVGVSATGQVGTVIANPSTTSLVGVAATGQVGTVISFVQKTPVGAFGTGQVGTVAPTTVFFIVGVSAVGQVGRVFPAPPAPLHRPPLFIPAMNGYPASIWAGD